MRLSSSSIGAIRRPKAHRAPVGRGSRTAEGHPVSQRSSGGMALPAWSSPGRRGDQRHGASRDGAAWLRPPRLTVKPGTDISGRWLPSGEPCTLRPRRAAGRAAGPGGEGNPACAGPRGQSMRSRGRGPGGVDDGDDRDGPRAPALDPAQCRSPGEVPGRCASRSYPVAALGAIFGATGSGPLGVGPSTFPPSTVRSLRELVQTGGVVGVDPRVMPARRTRQTDAGVAAAASSPATARQAPGGGAGPWSPARRPAVVHIR